MDNKIMRQKLFYIIGIVATLFVFYQDPAVKNLLTSSCVPVSGNGHIYSWQCLSEHYAPTELVNLVDRDNYLYYPHQLSKPAAIAVNKLIKEAEEDGMCLVVMGGYRSAKTQEDMWKNTPIEKRSGVARPYRSEHQTGLAVDFTACPMDATGIRNDEAQRLELKNDFESLPEYEWLVNHASDYGFVQSYTKSNAWITGYPAESWHWKYIVH